MALICLNVWKKNTPKFQFNALFINPWRLFSCGEPFAEGWCLSFFGGLTREEMRFSGVLIINIYDFNGDVHQQRCMTGTKMGRWVASLVGSTVFPQSTGPTEWDSQWWTSTSSWWTVEHFWWMLRECEVLSLLGSYDMAGGDIDITGDVGMVARQIGIWTWKHVPSILDTLKALPNQPQPSIYGYSWVCLKLEHPQSNGFSSVSNSTWRSLEYHRYGSTIINPSSTHLTFTPFFTEIPWQNKTFTIYHRFSQNVRLHVKIFVLKCHAGDHSQ